MRSFSNGWCDMVKEDLPLTREQLYAVLINNFHEDVWHCSKTKDGLVEIQFFVKEDNNEK